MKKRFLMFVAGVFFVIGAATVVSAVSSEEWTLKVESQAEFNIDEFKALPTAETERQGFTYKGVLLRDFLTYAGIDVDKIEYVELVASDGYSVRYEGELVRSSNVILAYEKNGSSLSEKEGKVRAIVVGGRSAMQIKAVEMISVKISKKS